MATAAEKGEKPALSKELRDLITSIPPELLVPPPTGPDKGRPGQVRDVVPVIALGETWCSFSLNCLCPTGELWLE